MSYGEKTKLLWKNPDYKKKMVEAHRGQKAWNRIENWKNCLTCTKKFRKSPKLKAKYCSRPCYYKSLLKEKPGYMALHAWVYKKLGKAKSCEHCGVKKAKFEWANKSRKYKRDITDWLQLCQRCHQKYDKNV